MIALGYFWYIVYGIIIITLITVLIFALVSRRFFKTILFNSLLGLCAIVLINLTSKFTGVHIPLNYYTVFGGASLGIAGVIGVLILNLIMI